MIPKRLLAFSPAMPWLDEAIAWSLLREWALSEVYRVDLQSDGTRIVKWGGHEMAGEAAIYQRLLQPLKIPSPILYEYHELDASAVMVMEDCGNHNLEQKPGRDYFLEAARMLGYIRETATDNLSHLSDNMKDDYTVSAEHFLILLDDLLRSKRLEGNDCLARLLDKFPAELRSLYDAVPLTLVHHDYHAKNLLIQENRILPIDWSLAYLSPHLGDLYCLINEAQSFSDVSRDEMLAAFRRGLHTDVLADQLEWQVKVGGICWLVKTLKWLVYGGTDIIPGSDAWIPDLMNDLELLSR